MTSEWTPCRLGDLLSSIDSGVSVNSLDRPADEGELGVLKLSALSDGQFRPLEHKTVLPDEAARVTISPRAGRILISRANTPELVGASTYVDSDYPNLFLPDLIWQLEPGPNQFSMRWLAYLLDSDEFRAKIRRLAAGSNPSMIKITKRSLRDLEVRLPPLGVQERHVEVLATWDRIIRTLESLLAARRERMRGLMQVLLKGKRRFKEFHDLPRPKVSLSSQIDRIVGGGTPSRSEPSYWDSTGIPWITVKDLKRGVIWDTEEHISERGLRESSATLVPAGTVIVATRMAVGKSVRCQVPAAINQDLKALFPKSTLRSDYLHLVLQASQQSLEAIASGSTVKGIRLADLRGLTIELPSVEEQARISAALSVAEKELETLERQLEAYSLQKRGLMQQLLTGKKRMRVERSEPVPA